MRWYVALTLVGSMGLRFPLGKRVFVGESGLGSPLAALIVVLTVGRAIGEGMLSGVGGEMAPTKMPSTEIEGRRSTASSPTPLERLCRRTSLSR